MEKVQLTKNSWIEIYRNVCEVSEEEFNQFWDKHPEEHHKIMIMGNLVDIPRWQKLYGVGSYKFSGTVSIGDMNIPDFVEKCFKISRKLYPDYNWNGALVNWYENGNNYIGAHSDDENDLEKNSPILSFSFGAERIFRIKKKNLNILEEHDVTVYDFITEDRSMIAMCGDMQKEYKHEITKTKKKINKRINVTIRTFKNT